MLSCQVFYPSIDSTPLVLTAYQPNLVARQFGLCQFLPSSIYKDKAEILFGKQTKFRKKADLLNIMHAYRKRRGHLEPVKFEPCFYTTPKFQEFWSNYQKTVQIPLAQCKDRMLKAFSALQIGDPAKKTKGTHCREIMAFEKYFHTAYQPHKISLTISDAAKVLHEKISERAKKNKTSLSFDDPSKSDFEKYCPRFPPLPNSNFGLAQGIIPPKHLPLFQSNLFLNIIKAPRNQVTLSKISFDQWSSAAHFDWSAIDILTKFPLGKYKSIKNNRNTPILPGYF